MERILMMVGVLTVMAVGAIFAVCAFANLFEKIRNLSLLKMPKTQLLILGICAGIATFAGQKGGGAEPTGGGDTPRLVLHCTFDSADAVTSPAVGSSGTCLSSATFGAGKKGSALQVPAYSEIASLALTNGLPQSKGCIEFWAKLEGVGGNYGGDGGGFPIFYRVNSAANGGQFMAFEFLANNGGSGGGLCAGAGALRIIPESASYMKPYSTYIQGDVAAWHHYAYVWNVDGIAGLSGECQSAILVDGTVVAQRNGEDGWSKDEYRALMGQSSILYFGNPSQSRTTFSIDELKIWDTDKTTFGSPKPVYHDDVTAIYDGQAHALSAPVGATGEETFLYALNQEGPFGDEMPSLTNAGSVRIWYKETIGGETVVTSAVVTVEKRPLTFTSASASRPYDGTPLATNEVLVTGTLPAGEGFSFSVTGERTEVGESENTFTWVPDEGTDSGNYDISSVFGKLTVAVGPAPEGMEYEVSKNDAGEDVLTLTQLAVSDGGEVVVPVAVGGLPVASVAADALAGASGATSVSVPPGITVAGALFENLAEVTNVALAAGSAVSGTLSFRGSATLREVSVPASTEIAPWTFLGCWALERVVFSGEPPFGGDASPGSDATALLTASVRPATLLQMADMICYPVAHAAKWEKSLRNLGYGGRYGAYEGEWTGEGSLVADSGNLNTAAQATLVVSNVIVSVVTNVLVPATPDESPAARYDARAGSESGTILAGAAGWDAFGLPDGMTWDRDTGTLGGVPVRSGTYDVMLVSGSGADTKLMRTTVDVAGYAVTTGYVGVAFKVSGSPWNAFASYKNPPAGLIWKSKVLSGVPTKAGTYTYKTKSGEPVKIAILALPVGAKGKFNGILVDGAGKRYPLTVSATAAGKLSATVVKGTKSYSLSAAKWSSTAVETIGGAPHRMFSATLTASGLSLSVKVDADAAWNADALTAVGTLGALKNLAGTAQRNAYADCDEAKAAAAGLVGTYSLAAASDGAGGWTLSLPAEGAKGALNVVLKASGEATLSGTLPDKKKVSASTTLYVDSGMAPSLRFYVKGVWIVWRY